MPQEELLMGRLRIMSHNVWKNDKNLPARVGHIGLYRDPETLQPG